MTFTINLSFLSAMILIWGALASPEAKCSSIDELLKGYYEDSKKSDPKFKGFDVERGKSFYHAERPGKDGKAISCAKCHTPDPRRPGQSSAGKIIQPMAPSVNPKRFTDKSKVEKWFKRNCMDVYQRACSSLEKGDFIKYLQSMK